MKCEVYFPVSTGRGHGWHHIARLKLSVSMMDLIILLFGTVMPMIVIRIVLVILGREVGCCVWG